MKFLIEIESDTQPGLIYQLERAIKRLKEGGCWLNCANLDGDVQLKPGDDSTHDRYGDLWTLSHPKRQADWLD